MKTVNTNLRCCCALWIALVSAMSHAADGMETKKPMNPEQRRVASFGKADLNGDGFVTREEFAEANHLSSSTPTSDRDIRAIRIMEAFQGLDKNVDGRVSGKEYVTFMERNGG